MRQLGKIGFVGTGGGCKGAISVGMLKALYEAGITPDYVYGVSVNVLNFAKLLSSGGTDSLVKIWKEIEKKGYNSLFDRKDIPWRLRANSIFDSKGTLQLANSLNASALINSKIRLEFPLHNEL